MTRSLPLDQLSELDARVVLFDDEPAYALAGRLARRNGVKSLATFGGDQGVHFYDIIRGRKNEEVAKLARADVRILDRATFVVERSDRVRLGWEVLHQDDWSYQSLRVCPACLRNDLGSQRGSRAFRPHIRSWWNLVCIEACPFHHVRLVDCDPADPSMKIDHETTDVQFAAGDQCDLASDDLSLTPVENVQAEAYILGRLGFMPATPTSVLDDLPLWNAIRLMDRFGAVAAGGPAAYTANGGSIPRRDALSAGYLLFADGKKSLFSFLDQIIANAEVKEGKWGPRRVYGRIYKWLGHDTSSRVYDPIRELVREHIIDNLPLASETDIFGRPVGRRRLHTLYDASKVIGQHPDMLRRTLVGLERITPHVATKPNSRIIIGDEEVQELCALLHDRLNFNEARAYLGLPRAPMLNLFERGVLKPFMSTDDGPSEHMFRKRDLDSFIADLLGSAPALRAIRSDLVNVVDAGKRTDTSTAEIVELIQEGRLACAGRLPTATGLLQVIVRLPEAKAAVARPTGSGLSIEDARSALGITHPVIRALINGGHLATYTVVGVRNKKRELVHAESFEEFQRTYISATDVAAAKGTHVRVLVPRLLASGVEAAIKKSAVGQYFYRREDLVGHMTDRVVAT